MLDAGKEDRSSPLTQSLFVGRQPTIHFPFGDEECMYIKVEWCTFVYLRVYVCTHTCVCLCIGKYIRSIYVRTYVRTLMYSHVYMYVHTYMYLICSRRNNTNVNVHTYICSTHVIS